MVFLGEPLPGHEQDGKTLAPRRIIDKIEEMLFLKNRSLFSKLALVFFDTSSIYFEGRGGRDIGRRGFSKDHRPDLHQMVAGAVLDDDGLVSAIFASWPTAA